jgi:hypothetical protein
MGGWTGVVLVCVGLFTAGLLVAAMAAAIRHLWSKTQPSLESGAEFVKQEGVLGTAAAVSKSSREKLMPILWGKKGKRPL